MSETVKTPLELLEEGHKEADAVLVALKEQWKADDEALKAERAAILEAHAQGARDRDAVRVAMGGKSVVEAKPEPTETPARPRASSLPAQPLAALGQTDKPADKSR